MLRSILVALDASPWSEAATDLAIEWSKRFGAKILGLGILDEPGIRAAEPAPIGVSRFKIERDEARLVEANEQVKRLVARFKSVCEVAGVCVDTIQLTGDPKECILHQAHAVDLVMLGSETHFRFATQEVPDSTLAKVLRTSPRPIVTVPRQSPAGTGLLVAYGGGREAARMLQTALLLGLACDETIHILAVRKPDRSAEALAPLAIQFLEAHDARYQLHLLESNAGPADVLLEQVGIIRPRLVVMGAHGEHRWRDLFSDSVTRMVVRSCPVPVLAGA
jgi:nucleotide-binding universal stress UspA family protein